jgi:hypothetical protein
MATRVFGALFVLCFAACATVPPPPPPMSGAERIQRDLAVGAGLARQFEARLTFKQDKDVLIYLRELAEKLSQTDSELRSGAVGVMVIQDRGSRWRDYALPGNRIYLSAGLIKRITYENELAALIALELGHIVRRHIPLRLQSSAQGDARLTGVKAEDYPSLHGLLADSPEGSAPVDFFSPTGIYAFPDEYFLEATDNAVEMLYQAGFDPRAVVSMWEMYEKSPEHSPFERPLLVKLQERARRLIADHSPLRNPIVRSQAFLAIQKRMKKL